MVRTAFIEGLIELARRDERVVLIVGDLGYSVIEPFVAEFPDRFYNAGISEQNMMGMAAGLSSEGLKVFVYSIANFPTFRCAEQIRNDVAYHGFPVTTVSVGGGLVYGNMGYSHHAIQDYALMRVMPGMKILAPGDPQEVMYCLETAFASNGPCYLRLGNPGTPEIHSSSLDLASGTIKFVAGVQNSSKVLLTTGATLALANSWLELPEYKDFGLYSMPVWGMEYRSEITAKFDESEEVITVEDHLLDGGFGSWILESLSQSDPTQSLKLRIKALSPEVTKFVAKEESLRSFGGLVP